MPEPRRGPRPTELSDLLDSLDGIGARLRTLEAPDGSQLYQTVKTLEMLVNDLAAQVAAAIAANSYTASTIDSKVQNPPAGSFVTGNRSATGNDAVAGNGSFGGTLGVTGAVFFPFAYGSDITYARRTAWLGNDGQLGYASSSAERKCEIRPADIDTRAVLSLEPKAFRYRDQVDKRGSKAAVEWGFLAEDLDEAGLSPFVYYDENGAPEGIEYSMLVVAQQAVIRDLAQRIERLEGN